MRTTKIHCSSCGSTILGCHSIITVEAGDPTRQRTEPIDLWRDCSDRFGDWLCGAHQTAVNGSVASTEYLAVGSGAVVG